MGNAYGDPTCAIEAWMITFVAISIGLLYIAAGVLSTRILAGDTVDDDWAVRAGEKVRHHRWMTLVGVLGSALTFACGLSLLLQSRWTPLLFVSNALLQGGYVWWAERNHGPLWAEAEGEDFRTPPSFIAHLGALAFVVYLDWADRWRPLLQPAAAELLVGASVTLLAYKLQEVSLERSGNLVARPKQPVEAGGGSRRCRQRRIRLTPRYRQPPLWDEELGRPVTPRQLGISEALSRRIEAWDAVFQAACSAEDPSMPRSGDLASRQAWIEEGEAIALELAREWPGPVSMKLMVRRDPRIDKFAITYPKDEER